MRARAGGARGLFFRLTLLPLVTPNVASSSAHDQIQDATHYWLGQMDTDLLVALVLSSLPQPTGSVPQDAVLQALADSGGDVNRAVAALHTLSRKRKREGDLIGWLHTTATPEAPESSDSRANAARFSASSGKEALPSPSSSRRPPGDSRRLARLPPLTLATPELIKLHTPTTLRTTVLPQDLACQLFYYMVSDAETWPRNTWYLFDKLVTSPHRTTFLIRSRRDSAGDSQEMASFW